MLSSYQRKWLMYKCSKQGSMPMNSSLELHPGPHRPGDKFFSSSTSQGLTRSQSCCTTTDVPPCMIQEGRSRHHVWKWKVSRLKLTCPISPNTAAFGRSSCELGYPTQTDRETLFKRAVEAGTVLHRKETGVEARGLWFHDILWVLHGTRSHPCDEGLLTHNLGRKNTFSP